MRTLLNRKMKKVRSTGNREIRKEFKASLNKGKENAWIFTSPKPAAENVQTDGNVNSMNIDRGRTMNVADQEFPVKHAVQTENPDGSRNQSFL